LLSAILGLAACAAAPVNKATPLVMSSVKAADEPCWIRTPDCGADATRAALYFVGQSDQPRASWGRPSRTSVHSAQRDAEQQYARFLGVDIESSTYLQSLFEDERYQSQFEHTMTAKVDRRVSELSKADEYFVAYQQTAEGEPLWTVYVLIKIAKADVAKHRLAVADEIKRRAEEIKRRASAPPPPDQWVASVFNIDDSVSVYVNNTKINQCDFSRSCDIQLSPHFKSGRNKVRLEYKNHAVFWTYGYEILKNDEIMYRGRCGQVWLYGCGNWSTQLGVVHGFEFHVDHP